MKSHIELIKQARIELPVAAQKTTVYVPRMNSEGYHWIATTTSEVVGGSEDTERDEARAKLIALALNHHLEFMEALRECFTDPGALAYEDFNSAKRRIKAINDTILEALSKS